MAEVSDLPATNNVQPTSATDDPMIISAGMRQQVAEGLAQEKGIPVEAIRAGDLESRIEREPGQLSRRQALAIDLLLKGLSLSETARQVGVTRRTIHRWRYNHPQFIAVYSRITQECGEQSARRAEQLVYQALEIVGDALNPKNEPKSRISAAMRVLNSMRVSRLLFTSPGESHFNLALDDIIRKQRLHEGIDPDLPVNKHDRESALHLLESENTTELADEIEVEKK